MEEPLAGEFQIRPASDPQRLLERFNGRLFNEPEPDAEWGATFEILEGDELAGGVWADADGVWCHIAIESPVGKAGILNAALDRLGPALRLALDPDDSEGLIFWVYRHLGFRPYGTHSPDVLLERVRR